MDRRALKSLLSSVRDGDTSIDAALQHLRDFPVAELAHATIDTHRALRRGFPEVVMGQGKTDSQLNDITARVLEHGTNLLVTRLALERGETLVQRFPGHGGQAHADACAVSFCQSPVAPQGVGTVAIVTAGTSDIPVAAEAALTCKLMGHEVRQINDVGVAGLHRLLKHLPTLREAKVLIVVAGMDGALASVVGGLVDHPVIAVPTSTGYGAALGGIAALLSMLNACAAGVTVVNIDNGFGAGYAAALMNRRDTP